jgi:lipopolysaccharide export LptBFGC system permease protein LptF|tara:strand:- start:436 stop:750 length:315 start_codon:yes stop_codon:yes gene_type:complete
MKKIGLFCVFSLVLISAFAAFPIESQLLLSETDPEGFKLDTWGFIIGILTMPFLIFYGLPLALLFVNKKHFRKSLALGWLAGLVLVILLVIAIELVPSGGLLIY